MLNPHIVSQAFGSRATTTPRHDNTLLTAAIPDTKTLAHAHSDPLDDPDAWWQSGVKCALEWIREAFICECAQMTDTLAVAHGVHFFTWDAQPSPAARAKPFFSSSDSKARRLAMEAASYSLAMLLRPWMAQTTISREDMSLVVCEEQCDTLSVHTESVAIDLELPTPKGHSERMAMTQREHEQSKKSIGEVIDKVKGLARSHTGASRVMYAEAAMSCAASMNKVLECVETRPWKAQPENQLCRKHACTMVKSIIIIQKWLSCTYRDRLLLFLKTYNATRRDIQANARDAQRDAEEKRAHLQAQWMQARGHIDTLLVNDPDLDPAARSAMDVIFASSCDQLDMDTVRLVQEYVRHVKRLVAKRARHIGNQIPSTMASAAIGRTDDILELAKLALLKNTTHSGQSSGMSRMCIARGQLSAQECLDTLLHIEMELRSFEALHRKTREYECAAMAALEEDVKAALVHLREKTKHHFAHYVSRVIDAWRASHSQSKLRKQELLRQADIENNLVVQNLEHSTRMLVHCDDGSDESHFGRATECIRQFNILVRATKVTSENCFALAEFTYAFQSLLDIWQASYSYAQHTQHELENVLTLADPMMISCGDDDGAVVPLDPMLSSPQLLFDLDDHNNQSIYKLQSYALTEEDPLGQPPKQQTSHTVQAAINEQLTLGQRREIFGVQTSVSLSSKDNLRKETPPEPVSSVNNKPSLVGILDPNDLKRGIADAFGPPNKQLASVTKRAAKVNQRAEDITLDDDEKKKKKKKEKKKKHRHHHRKEEPTTKKESSREYEPPGKTPLFI